MEKTYKPRDFGARADGTTNDTGAVQAAIDAASSDGIDIDACANVAVRDCDFDTDDDCVCLKGGKGADAHVRNRPTENVFVERCRFGFGHGISRSKGWNR